MTYVLEPFDQADPRADSSANAGRGGAFDDALLAGLNPQQREAVEYRGPSLLIVGWGSMFPIFGWTPRFAADHTPRFPVAMPPPPDPSKRAPILTDAEKKTTADKTIRRKERGRQGRRGRRR